jgi:hypothetical protein
MFQQFIAKLKAWFLGAETKVKAEVHQVEDIAQTKYEDTMKVNYDSKTLPEIQVPPRKLP